MQKENFQAISKRMIEIGETFMNVKFKNCGNIKTAELELAKGKINIKFGLNGIGKTTLGKCLDAFIASKQDNLDRYIPYGSNGDPEVFQKGLKSSLYFDEEYVENYLFQDDLINKSFEIVVKTPDYDKRISEIQKSFVDLLSEIQNDNISATTSELKTLTDSIKFTKENDFDGKSLFTKGVKKINPEKILDSNAIIYKALITSPNNHAWIEWFRAGKAFIYKNNCPFCLATLSDDFNAQYDSVTKSFEKNALKNSSESNSKLASLRKYVDPKTANQILNDQQEGTISDHTKTLIKANMDVLAIEKTKLDAIRNIDPLSLVALSKEDLTARFSSYKLNDKLFSNISSELESKINEINIKLENVISKIDELNVQLGQLKGTLSNSIKKVSDFVNDFLVISGIPYKIEVEVSGQNSARTILKPINLDIEVNEPKASLSFGELNSLSLILFCVEAINKDYDLIVLDDPVSSFDGNKKYAIMYQLFSSRVGNNLRGKTVLLFTHDFTPIIDFVYHGQPTQDEAIAYYLYNSDGNLSETKIERTDIISCIDAELASANDARNNYLRRIVSLRNYYDMTKLNESAEYSILSSLLHLKETPTKKDNSTYSDADLHLSTSSIKSYIYDFDYSAIYKKFSEKTELKKLFNEGTSIDKIFATRLLLTLDPSKQENKVLWKFLNENFHPQNILFYGLDNTKFELIPDHILKSCKELFDSI